MKGKAGGNVLIGNVYVRPNFIHKSTTTDILQHILGIGNILLFGDFNDPSGKWTRAVANRDGTHEFICLIQLTFHRLHNNSHSFLDGCFAPLDRRVTISPAKQTSIAEICFHDMSTWNITDGLSLSRKYRFSPLNVAFFNFAIKRTMPNYSTLPAWNHLISKMPNIFLSVPNYSVTGRDDTSKRIWTRKYWACNYRLHLAVHHRIIKRLSSSTKSFWRILKNSKYVRWRVRASRWIRDTSDKSVVNEIIEKLSFGAGLVPNGNWLKLPLLRSLNNGDLTSNDLLRAWDKSVKMCTNNFSAPSKCLIFIDPSIKPAIISCILRASEDEWEKINISRRILLVKGKKRTVTFPSDLSPISIQNSLVSLYEKALADYLMEFCVEKDIIS
ncbi:hypothetical protein ACOME3_008259 [Neoechinorhynchus agilis]